MKNLIILNSRHLCVVGKNDKRPCVWVCSNERVVICRTNTLADGLPVASICKYTGLSAEEVVGL